MEIATYPRKGSRWDVTLGPAIPRLTVTVLGGGHGNVVFKSDEDRHASSVDVLAWHRRLNPSQVEDRW